MVCLAMSRAANMLAARLKSLQQLPTIGIHRLPLCRHFSHPFNVMEAARKLSWQAGWLLFLSAAAKTGQQTFLINLEGSSQDLLTAERSVNQLCVIREGFIKKRGKTNKC